MVVMARNPSSLTCGRKSTAVTLRNKYIRPRWSEHEHKEYKQRQSAVLGHRNTNEAGRHTSFPSNLPCIYPVTISTSITAAVRFNNMRVLMILIGTVDADQHQPKHHQRPTWQSRPSHLPACSLLSALVAIFIVRIKAIYTSRTTGTERHPSGHGYHWTKRCISHEGVQPSLYRSWRYTAINTRAPKISCSCVAFVVLWVVREPKIRYDGFLLSYSICKLTYLRAYLNLKAKLSN